MTDEPAGLFLNIDKDDSLHGEDIPTSLDEFTDDELSELARLISDQSAQFGDGGNDILDKLLNVLHAQRAGYED